MSAPAIATGPRTPEGKQRSSMNACKHNLTGGTALLPSEDPEVYAAHHEAQNLQYKPVSQHETHLVKELADAMWRLDRAHQYEHELLASVENPFLEEDEKFAIQLQRLTRYISSIERTYYRAYNELKRINADRDKGRPAFASFDFHGNHQPKEPKEPEKTGIQNELPATPVQPAEPVVQNERSGRKLPASVSFMLREFDNFQKTGKIG